VQRRITGIIGFGLIYVAAAVSYAAPQRVGSTAAPAGGEVEWSVKTVGPDGEALFAQQLEWWVVGDTRSKRVVKCPQAACAAWALELGQQSTVALQFVVKKIHAHDPSCEDLFTAKLTADEIRLTNIIHLQRNLAVCA
jgi:hypothetical protein